ncbi:MAG TPA: J domain-containing protein [Rhabdochlamydiaceae bacterium]|nr:J domain-containing protein [Rhabdochlamydiaceae bacterium]
MSISILNDLFKSIDANGALDAKVVEELQNTIKISELSGQVLAEISSRIRQVIVRAAQIGLFDPSIGKTNPSIDKLKKLNKEVNRACALKVRPKKDGAQQKYQISEEQVEADDRQKKTIDALHKSNYTMKVDDLIKKIKTKDHALEICLILKSVGEAEKAEKFKLLFEDKLPKKAKKKKAKQKIDRYNTYTCAVPEPVAQFTAENIRNLFKNRKAELITCGLLIDICPSEFALKEAVIKELGSIKDLNLKEIEKNKEEYYFFMGFALESIYQTSSDKRLKEEIAELIVVLQEVADESSDEPDFSSKDPYEVLGISRKADLKAIRKRYLQLSLIHHPDKNPPQLREQKNKDMQAIIEAWKKLQK